jgi:hypothetical protein
MEQLRWSDFDWFKKKTKVQIDDTYFRCSEKNGIDQKIIFPLKEIGKHLTFSLSHKYLDLHVTAEDRTVPQRNILNIRLRKANKMIQQTRKPEDVIFLPFSHKMLKHLILVNPYTKEFIKNIQRMDSHNIMPTALTKVRIHSMRNNHGKILVAFNIFGQFKGILRCNHHDVGFYLVPASSITKFEQKLVDSLIIKKILTEEGVKDNSRYKIFWQRWYRVLIFIQYIKNMFSIRLNSRSSR